MLLPMMEYDRRHYDFAHGQADKASRAKTRQRIVNPVRLGFAGTLLAVGLGGQISAANDLDAQRIPMAVSSGYMVSRSGVKQYYRDSDLRR